MWAGTCSRIPPSCPGYTNNVTEACQELLCLNREREKESGKNSLSTIIPAALLLSTFNRKVDTGNNKT